MYHCRSGSLSIGWLFVLGPGCHSSYVDNHDQAELNLQLTLNTNQSVVHCWRVVLSIGQVFDLKHGKYKISDPDYPFGIFIRFLESATLLVR